MTYSELCNEYMGDEDAIGGFTVIRVVRGMIVGIESNDAMMKFVIVEDGEDCGSIEWPETQA